jgi:tRNA (cytidine/uridine-2'-O-)-methyltransferase
VCHATWADFEATRAGARLFCFSARASKIYTRVTYQAGDYLLFGSESRGLPPGILARDPEQTLGIPQPARGVRSLNLATAVGIVLYEALRQLHHW